MVTPMAATKVQWKVVWMVYCWAGQTGVPVADTMAERLVELMAACLVYPRAGSLVGQTSVPLADMKAGSKAAWWAEWWAVMRAARMVQSMAAKMESPFSAVWAAKLVAWKAGMSGAK